MKKLILLLLLPSILVAGGPKYKNTGTVQMEIENIYHDIDNSRPVVLQSVQATTTSNFTTTETTFQDTNLTASIEVKKTSRVRVSISMILKNVAGDGAIMGLKRNSTDLFTTSVPIGVIYNPDSVVACNNGPVYIDSPGITGTVTYVVRGASIAGGTATFGNTQTQVIILEELSE